MSRAATGDVVYEKPRNNVYTVLVAVALIAEITAFVILFQKAVEVFGTGNGILN
jgi:hypothetical protein